MKWVKRGLWTAAWGAWLWLGFGLYRELPRDLGPSIGRLEFGIGDTFVGWIAGEPTAVTIEDFDDEPRKVARTWDARTGRQLSEFTVPAKPHYYFLGKVNARHGLIANEARPQIEGRSMHDGWSILDLKSGAWLDLPCGPRERLTFAPTTPRVAFSRGENSPPSFPGVRSVKKNDDSWRVVVVDCRSGRILLEIRDDIGGQPPRAAVSVPVFLGDDAIALQTRIKRGPREKPEPMDVRVEVWRLDAPERPIQVWPGVSFASDVMGASNRRIAWHAVGTRPQHVDVFDLDSGRLVLSYPPVAERDAPKGDVLIIRGYWPAPLLSPNGKAVYFNSTNAVIDVDSGMVRWEGDSSLVNWVDTMGRIEIVETWPPSWLRWIPQQKTFALRDLDDWRLIHRTWLPTLDREDRSGVYEWLLDDGFVFPLPPSVNHPLLALCQAVLALPLVLMWAVLRWRRKRQLRLASVQP